MASPTTENESPNRMWKRVHGLYELSSANFRATLSNLSDFASLFRSRWDCFPLPLSSRIMCEPSRVHWALEDIFACILKNLRRIEKDIEFWEDTAERSDFSKSCFMLFERGPRAFFQETAHSLRGRPHQLSESARIYINERLTLLTNLRKLLAIFLAQVYTEVNNIGEELTNDSEQKLPTLLGIMKDLFTGLDESVRHLHENCQSYSSVDGTYSSPSLFDNMPNISQDGSRLTESEIKDAIDWLYGNLQKLDSCISFLVSQHKKPRKITQYWIHYSCGAVGLSVCSIWLLGHSGLMGSSDNNNWIRDAKDSTFGFCAEHVKKPLLPIIAEPFVTFQKKHIGNMEQEMKLASEAVHRAILELKQIQCANEINFAVHVIPPVLYLSYVFMMGVRACFKQMNAWFKQDKKAEGRDKIAWPQWRLLLVEIEKNMMLCEHFAELGEVNDAQYLFGLLLYKLNLLSHSVKGLAEDYEDWLRVREEIISLASPDLPTSHKVRAVKRLIDYDCLLPVRL